MGAPKNPGMLSRLWRMARYRLHIPIIRNKQPVHVVARGVMVGMIWAMTPFFGLHMTFVLATWLFTTRILKWDFSLVNGLAWTWTTNVFTVLPAFYLFYLTGQTLLGNWSDPLGYDTFKTVFHIAEERAAGDPENAGSHLWELWNAFGLPLFLGSAVWSVLSGWVAYNATSGFLTRYREHRAHKMARARKRGPVSRDPGPLTKASR